MNPVDTYFRVPTDTDRKIEYLYDFARIIWADGKVDDEERRVLKKYCVIFGFEVDSASELSDWLLENAKENISHKELITKIKNLLNT